ncbi:hypothetical protein AB205_0015690 [Aquarana catesbeiana]|uniref:Uncharacterized protein n=1 Tax=Aquarana catesbeiana TaxID=8400 RepID=A0A2G9RWQ4_AQUCT|nr:hypothetical protein AB205_0015690 [Aquarana catesbeiana]
MHLSNRCGKIVLWVSVVPSHCNPIEVLLMKARIGLAVKKCNDMHLSNRCGKNGLWVLIVPMKPTPKTFFQVRSTPTTLGSLEVLQSFHMPKTLNRQHQNQGLHSCWYSRTDSF